MVTAFVMKELNGDINSILNWIWKLEKNISKTLASTVWNEIYENQSSLSFFSPFNHSFIVRSVIPKGALHVVLKYYV